MRVRGERERVFIKRGSVCVCVCVCVCVKERVRVRVRGKIHEYIEVLHSLMPL